MSADAELEVAQRPAFVSRGGVKLANALDAFGIDPAGRRALDVGASTGGFSDCLLQRGAASVIALDVAYGELHWSLRQDPRVTVIERSNARSLSARASCPTRRTWSWPTCRSSRSPRSCPPCSAAPRRAFDCLALVKPQFEVGRERVGRGGVVRSAAERRAALVAVAGHVRAETGAEVLGFASSGLPGPAGNRESFVWLAEAGRRGGAVADLEAAARVAEP